MAKFFDGQSNIAHKAEVVWQGHRLLVVTDQEYEFVLKDCVVSFISSEEIHLRHGMKFLELTKTDVCFPQVYERLHEGKKKNLLFAAAGSVAVFFTILIFLLFVPFLSSLLPDSMFASMMSKKKSQELFSACMLPKELNDKLLAQAKIKDDFEIGIIAFPMMNAFAVPTNQIYITDKLLKALQYEDELLALVGHEAGHLQKKHYKATMFRFYVFDMISSVFNFKGGRVLNGILMNSYSQTQELDADSSGANVLAESQHSFKGGVELMARFEKEEIPMIAFVPEFLLSHPDTSLRKAAFAELDRRSPKDLRPLNLGAEMLKACP